MRRILAAFCSLFLGVLAGCGGRFEMTEKYSLDVADIQGCGANDVVGPFKVEVHSSAPIDIDVTTADKASEVRKELEANKRPAKGTLVVDQQAKTKDWTTTVEASGKAGIRVFVSGNAGPKKADVTVKISK